MLGRRSGRGDQIADRAWAFGDVCFELVLQCVFPSPGFLRCQYFRMALAQLSGAGNQTSVDVITRPLDPRRCHRCPSVRSVTFSCHPFTPRPPSASPSRPPDRARGPVTSQKDPGASISGGYSSVRMEAACPCWRAQLLAQAGASLISAE